MKYHIYLFLVGYLFSTHIYAINSSEIEKIYTEAVDLRYNGDLAKSRHLVETLEDYGVRNEFLFAFLANIYKEYLLDLIQQKDFKTLRIGYLGIRTNLQKLFDHYPNNLSIQNDILLIADFMKDQELLQKIITRILAIDPEHLFANYFSGMQAMQTDDLFLAISSFLNVNSHSQEMSYDPFIFMSRQYLGGLYQKQGDYQRSLFYYRKSAEITLTTELIVLTALSEMYFRNFSEALQLLEQLPDILLKTQFCDLYVIALKGKNTPQSIEIMTKFLSEIKVQTPFSQAIVKDILGDTEEALKLLRKAHTLGEFLPWTYYTFEIDLLSRLGRNTDKYKGYHQLAMYFLRTNNIRLSKNLLLQIPSDYDTEGDIAYTLGAISAEFNDLSEAIRYYKEALSRKKDLQVYRGLIEALSKKGQFEEAEKILGEASNIEHYDNRWFTLYMFATIRSIEKKYEEAEKYLADLLVQFPSEAIFRNFLAVLYIEQEKYQLAEEHLEETHRMHKYDLITVNNLVYLYALTKKEYTRSLELIFTMMQQFPNNIMLLDTLAWLYFQNGEMELAQAVFEDIESILEKDAFISKYVEIFSHLGIFYREIANSKKSDFYFQKALEIDPEYRYLK